MRFEHKDKVGVVSIWSRGGYNRGTVVKDIRGSDIFLRMDSEGFRVMRETVSGWF